LNRLNRALNPLLHCVIREYTLAGATPHCTTAVRILYHLKHSVCQGLNLAKGIRIPRLSFVDEVRDSNAGEYGIEVTVLAPGVTGATIGEIILASRAGGVDTFGSTTVTVQTDDGKDKDESFNRATQVDIYVDVTLTTSNTFPSDGETQIEDKIIRHVGGEASDDVQYPGLEIGEDVIFDQVFRRMMEVQGVVEADVWIDIADDPNSQTNVAIAADEVAMTAPGQIDFS